MIDKSHMLTVLEEIPSQIKKGYFELAEKMKVEGKFKNIVFAGMGGSALPGDVIQSYLKDIIDIPICVHKSYNLPKFVDKNSLVFVVSYSGNTEETLSAYKIVRGKTCTTIAITSGGKLKKLAQADNKQTILIPGGIQPRLSLGYMFFAVLRLLENSGIVKSHKTTVTEIIEKLKNPDFKMKGEQLASNLVDKTPIIYSSDTMVAVAEIWKISFNENCKTTAFYNFFPELNHNEMLSHTHPKGKYYVILIREDDCHRQIIKRFKITRDLISKTSTTIEIVIKGNSQLLKIFTGIYIGYWTSYFLAIKYGIDPTPVEFVEKLKKKL